MPPTTRRAAAPARAHAPRRGTPVPLLHWPGSARLRPRRRPERPTPAEARSVASRAHGGGPSCLLDARGGGFRQGTSSREVAPGDIEGSQGPRRLRRAAPGAHSLLSLSWYTRRERFEYIYALSSMVIGAASAGRQAEVAHGECKKAEPHRRG